MTPAMILVMLAAGVIAAIGLLTNALHLVIGAMVIAPGFEPISRFSLGLLNKKPSWKVGMVGTVKGYSALVAGAALGTILLKAIGYAPETTQSTYLPTGALLSYWTSITVTSVLASAMAATAGAMLIIRQRSVLTAGVMIALALIPAAANVGIGLASWNTGLIASGLMRLVIEVLLVAVISLIVFFIKWKLVEKRKMSL